MQNLQQLAQKIQIGVGKANFDPTDPNATAPTPIEIKGPLKADITSVGDVISVALGFLYPVVALLLLVYLFWTGFQFMNSRGDPEKIKEAKAKMTAAIIGFVLFISAVLVAKLVARIVGIEQSIL